MECQITIPLIRHLLSKMNTEEVTWAQNRMKQYSNKTMQFFPIIYTIMTDPMQRQYIKILAASFLNQTIKSTLNEDNYLSFFQTLIEILTSPFILQKNKKIFDRSIIKCLQLGTQEKRYSWISFIRQSMNDINFYGAALIVINSISIADIPLDLLQKTISCSYQNLLKVEIKIENVELLSEIMKMWSLVVDKLHKQKKMRKFLKSMICSQLWLNMMRAVYQVQAAENTILCQQQSFSQLNLIKKQAAELNKKMLDISMQRSDGGVIRVLNLTEYFLPKFAHTLQLLANSKNHYLSKQNNEDIVVALLAIVRIYLTTRPDQFTLSDAVFFQKYVIFRLLAVNQDEIQSFQQSPQDFLSLAEDCYDKQVFGFVKTQAAKFIECLGDEIEGSIDYSIVKAIESVKYRFGYIQKSPVNSDDILQFQTALVILSIFSFKIPSYPMQIEVLRNLFADEQIKKVSTLELARIFTFLSYNYLQLFKEPEKGEQWIHFALNYQHHSTTRFCSFDFVSSVLDSYFSQTFLERIGQEIQKGNQNLIWQIVQKIIQHHFDLLSSQGFTYVTFKLFARIEKQSQMLRIQQKSNTLDIINCLRRFNDILKAVKTSYKDVDSKNFVISTVCQVFNFYARAVQLNIDGEIIKIAIQLIDSVQLVTPQIQQYTTEFIRIFKNKHSYSGKNYMRYFNQILNKSDFSKNYTILMEIMIVLKDAFQHVLQKLQFKKESKLKNYPHYRLILSNVLIIIQNFIALFGTYLLEIGQVQFIQTISQICTELLPRTKQNIQKTSSGFIINSRTLNTLFLCHMHLKVEQIHIYLNNLKSQDLYHGYDTKVIMNFISNQIFKQQQIGGVIFLLDVVRHIMEKSQLKQECLGNLKKKKNIQLRILNKIKKIDEYDNFLETIYTPFKTQKTPSLILTEIFLQMKITNQDMYNHVLQVLPAENFSFFSKYLDFDKIQSKKRSYKKVIGIKVAEQQENNIAQKQSDNDSDEDELNLKRQRIKIKREVKGLKSKQEQRKRRHVQQE